jgi:hypothetical protein
VFCEQCGSPIETGQKFCANCGRQLTIAVAARADQRVARHIQLLGILWIARGVLRLLGVAAYFLVGRYVFPAIADMVPFVSFLPRLVMVSVWLMAIGALASFAAGFGLLQREDWGRMAALIMGFVVLLSFPVGTALGIYTLWVLLPQRSEQEYEALARAA